jgi:hypothetical protein
MNNKTFKFIFNIFFKTILVLKRIFINFIRTLKTILTLMKFNFNKISTIILGGFIIASCNGSADKNEIDKDVLDPNSSINTNFDGKLFSIPSPIQISLLLKQANIPFNESLLNQTDKSKNYTTEYLQALNLGIYGTDLGYASINEQNGISLKYLSVVEGLTSKLGLEGAFDKNFMSRFEKYHTNKDSIMGIISDAFRKGDNFLKNAKRKSTSSLILAGGWIESINFACKLNSIKENQNIINRIGEQQQTLTSLIDILVEYNTNNSNDVLIADLNELKTIYEKVVIDYQFVAPKTDEAKKETTLQHTYKVKIEKEVLTEIESKISAIRAKIIN